MNDTCSGNDRAILRELGRQKAEIAHLDIQKQRREKWRRLNDLEPVHPLVWINEIPWNEMNVDDELTCRCGDPFLQRIETRLRQELYRWRHMPGHMIVDDSLAAPPALQSTRFGIDTAQTFIKKDDTSGVGSHAYQAQIRELDDVNKIKDPVLTLDRGQTDRDYALLCDIFDGVLTVVPGGIQMCVDNAWDVLVQWTGVETILLDLAMRPEFVHACMRRLTDAFIAYLDQLESLGLLVPNANNTRIGTGAYGYTKELPDQRAKNQTPKQLWGGAMAQIFSEVSPDMHEEFALQYEREWLTRFGLAYYGCCEPLDRKIAIVRRHIPNLRKISMSPWVKDTAGAAARCRDYGLVFSLKPSPAVLTGTFNPERIAADLKATLRTVKDAGANVEIIMKDISTVEYHPDRLWQWADIAVRAANEFN